jgi:osmotically-inducible protein OsmY
MAERFDHHRRERDTLLARLRAGRRPDVSITRDVRDRLADAPVIDSTEVDVSVHDGAVTVSGRVAESYEKRRVEDLIGQIWGVREVHNHLSVTAW